MPEPASAFNLDFPQNGFDHRRFALPVPSYERHFFAPEIERFASLNTI